MVRAARPERLPLRTPTTGYGTTRSQPVGSGARVGTADLPREACRGADTAAAGATQKPSRLRTCWPATRTRDPMLGLVPGAARARLPGRLWIQQSAAEAVTREPRASRGRPPGTRPAGSTPAQASVDPAVSVASAETRPPSGRFREPATGSRDRPTHLSTRTPAPVALRLPAASAGSGVTPRLGRRATSLGRAGCRLERRPRAVGVARPSDPRAETEVTAGHRWHTPRPSRAEWIREAAGRLLRQSPTAGTVEAVEAPLTRPVTGPRPRPLRTRSASMVAPRSPPPS